MLSSHISVPPQIGAFEFSDNPINSGDATSIFCTVSKGDFPIDLIWTLNGRNIVEYDGITVMRTTKRVSQLNIDSVQAEHAGKYVCTARNAAGNASHSTSLHVNGIFGIRLSSIGVALFLSQPFILQTIHKNIRYGNFLQSSFLLLDVIISHVGLTCFNFA